MRVIAALSILLLLATFAPRGLHMPPTIPAAATVAFAPLALDPDRPARRRLGRLVYLQGWSISSNDPRFGGISAIHVAGDRVRAMTDAGFLIEFALPGSAQAGAVAIRPLGQGPGKGATRCNRDAEAMAIAIANGTMWVAFEQHHQIWRYARDGSAEAWRAPAAMTHWRRNRGAEAMVRFPDGRFLVFAEGEENDGGTTESLLFDGDPAAPGTVAIPLRYRAPGGYRITDAALLTDGRILFLNRRVTLVGGLSAKLTLGALPPLRAGALLEGEEIAELQSPLSVDNMEALSVTRENGRDLVWVASDDNFSPRQRTLLLQFALAD